MPGLIPSELSPVPLVTPLRNLRLDEAWACYIAEYKQLDPILINCFSTTINYTQAANSIEVKKRLDEALFNYLAEFDRDQRERHGDAVAALLADYATGGEIIEAVQLVSAEAGGESAVCG